MRMVSSRSRPTSIANSLSNVPSGSLTAKNKNKKQIFPNIVKTEFGKSDESIVLEPSRDINSPLSKTKSKQTNRGASKESRYGDQYQTMVQK
jgi:hypothetical protein